MVGRNLGQQIDGKQPHFGVIVREQVEQQRDKIAQWQQKRHGCTDTLRPRELGVSAKRGEEVGLCRHRPRVSGGFPRYGFHSQSGESERESSSVHGKFRSESLLRHPKLTLVFHNHETVVATRLDAYDLGSLPFPGRQSEPYFRGIALLMRHRVAGWQREPLLGDLLLDGGIRLVGDSKFDAL